jgi:hypothetical protein
MNSTATGTVNRITGNWAMRKIAPIRTPVLMRIFYCVHNGMTQSEKWFLTNRFLPITGVDAPEGSISNDPGRLLLL